MEKDVLKLASVFVGGALIGSGITYLAVHKHLEKKWETYALEEIQQVKETYKLLTDKHENPREAFKAYVERLDDLQYGPAEQEEDRQAEIIEKTVVEETITIETEAEERERVREEALYKLKEHLEGGGAVRTIDISQEVRTKNEPYVITLAEFLEDDEHDKLTMTYFQKDDTLIDETEEIIPDVDRTVGTKNLSRFGDGSEDDSTVYVRNERLRGDIELTLDERSYVEVVLGHNSD